MTRSHALSVALALVAGTTAAAQQATPRVVGPGGSGLQPQVAGGAYQTQSTAPAARGVNPFAGMSILPSVSPGTRFQPRQARAPAFVPLPNPGVPNNPAAFNPGIPPPFPLLIPPADFAPPSVAYNPLLVSRRGVVSAYYVPPTTPRSPGSASYPGDELLPPADDETGPFFPFQPGESRFLPWMW